MSSDLPPQPSQQQKPRWCGLSAIDRRVLGVLVEKAKTTPEGYPMSLNAIRSGCNQKNNRYPLMELEAEDVEESLTRLRSLGAVGEVQGGRVARYRHYMYEWLGVEKLELGVMTELLLRGAQTEGELRGRAARMDPIPDLGALRPILASLKEKGLVLPLTPEGRGHVVTHALYEPRELDKLRAEHSGGAAEVSATLTSPYRAPEEAADHADARATHRQPEQATSAASTSPAAAGARIGTAQPEQTDALRRELEQLRADVAKLRKDVDDLWSNFR